MRLGFIKTNEIIQPVSSAKVSCFSLSLLHRSSKDFGAAAVATAGYVNEASEEEAEAAAAGEEEEEEEAGAILRHRSPSTFENDLNIDFDGEEGKVLVRTRSLSGTTTMAKVQRTFGVPFDFPF